MEQVLTLVCKLQPTDEQAQHLEATLRRFAQACTYVHTTLPAHIRNKDRMQALIYYDVRSHFQLSANLAIQAIRRVAMTRKAAHETGRTVATFAATSIQYDARIFSFRERDHTVSVTLLHGRERLPLCPGELPAWQAERAAAESSPTVQTPGWHLCGAYPTAPPHDATTHQRQGDWCGPGTAGYRAYEHRAVLGRGRS